MASGCGSECGEKKRSHSRIRGFDPRMKVMMMRIVGQRERWMESEDARLERSRRKGSPSVKHVSRESE